MCEITQKYCDAVMFEEKVGMLYNILCDSIADDRPRDLAQILVVARAEALALAREIIAEEYEQK